MQRIFEIEFALAKVHYPAIVGLESCRSVDTARDSLISKQAYACFPNLNEKAH